MPSKKGRGRKKVLTSPPVSPPQASGQKGKKKKSKSSPKKQVSPVKTRRGRRQQEPLEVELELHPEGSLDSEEDQRRSGQDSKIAQLEDTVHQLMAEIKQMRQEGSSQNQERIPGRDKRGRSRDRRTSRRQDDWEDVRRAEEGFSSRTNWTRSHSRDESFATSSSGSSKGKPSSHNSLRSRKSGLTQKGTDRVRYPQTWPHTTLQDEMCLRHLSFEELDFRLFIAGELEIVTSLGITQLEKQGRLELMKQLAYFNGSYPWATLRNVYVSIVRKIELGTRTWGSNFTPEFQLILTKLGIGSSKGKPKTEGKKTDNKTDSDRIWFCHEYQKGTCTQGDQHSALIRGRTVSVKHICAKCWIKRRTIALHPECKCID